MIIIGVVESTFIYILVLDEMGICICANINFVYLVVFLLASNLRTIT
jgi:hypothetical protein